MRNFNELYQMLYVLKKLSVIERKKRGASLMHSAIHSDFKPLYARNIHEEIVRILENESSS